MFGAESSLSAAASALASSGMVLLQLQISFVLDIARKKQPLGA
jgi:hypothetical protein